MRISDWSSDVCSSDLRRSFGHAPGMADVDSRFHEPLDHRARARRTTDDHPVQLAIANARRVHMREHREPHRRHAGAVRHALIVHRSEEHTSELQSLMRISYAVFCLHKKTTTNTTTN